MAILVCIEWKSDGNVLSENFIDKQAQVFQANRISGGPLYWHKVTSIPAVLYLLSLQIEVGYRMPAPTDTPNEVNGVMQQCWQYDPEERPDFATLLNMLTDAAAKIKT